MSKALVRTQPGAGIYNALSKREVGPVEQKTKVSNKERGGGEGDWRGKGSDSVRESQAAGQLASYVITCRSFEAVTICHLAKSFPPIQITFPVARRLGMCETCATCTGPVSSGGKLFMYS